jgi:hypothetical protein
MCYMTLIVVKLSRIELLLLTTIYNKMANIEVEGIRISNPLITS